MQLLAVSYKHLFPLTWPSGPSWSSIVVPMFVCTSVCLSVLDFFLGLSLALRSNVQFPSTYWGMNTLEKNTLNYRPSDHMIRSRQPIVVSIPWQNVTFNYWPSDHMIRSCQPVVVASIPSKMLHSIFGYWLLSAYVKRIGISRIQDFFPPDLIRKKLCWPSWNQFLFFLCHLLLCYYIPLKFLYFSVHDQDYYKIEQKLFR